MGWFGRKEHDEEQLSAYLDGELDARQARSVESHLEQCETCAALLEELRATRSVLAALPVVTPRRSFVLGPEYAVQPQRPASASASRRFNLALVPAVTLSLFVGLLVIDLAGGTSSSSDDAATLTAANSRQAAEGEAQAGAAAMAPPAGTPDDKQAEAGTDSSAAGGAAATGSLGDAPNTGVPPAAITPPATGPMAATAAEEDEAAADETAQAFSAGSTGEPQPAEQPIAMADADAEPSDGDDGLSTLRVLQVLAGGAFLVSGLYVLVWPRLARRGS